MTLASEHAATPLIMPRLFVEERRAFNGGERAAVLIGAVAFGALAGLAASLTIGRIEWHWAALASLPPLALALYLASLTMRDALGRGAYGCAAAAGVHACALLAWPLTSLFIPLEQLNYFIAPGMALLGLALFASCWAGPERAFYRSAGQAALVAALCAQQGLLVVLS